MDIAKERTLGRTALLLLATLTCLTALAAAPTIADAATIHVDIATGNDFGGNGSDAWPYQHITKGLAEANYGDTVMVAEGEYSPATGETLPLVLPTGVMLQGDTSPLMASPNMIDTVVKGNDCCPLMTITGGDENTIVDGIAFLENDSPTDGGGISIVGGTAPGGGPQIRDCYFYGLAAPRGGAIKADKAAYPACQPRIERCLFLNCIADSGPMDGGAIFGSSADLWISKSYFIACYTADGGDGGGLYLTGPGASTLSGCWIMGCNAPNGTGGGIRTLGHSVGIISSIFNNNIASFGGAIYFQENADAIPDGLAVFNSAFIDNQVTGAAPPYIGAAIRIYDGTAQIRNCTLTENTGGSVLAEYSSNTSIYNSILWNTDASADDLLTSAGGVLSVAYSCVYDVGAENEGVGVIHTNPGMVDTGRAYRLLPTSPCIDTGSNLYASTTDIEDLPRVVDGDGNGSAIVDMGAWERNPRTDRAAGPNRYATAVEASEEHFDHAETVVLATGAAFPDALCAAPLAGTFYAPVLLTPPDSLAPAVATELERLETEKVYVIGGTGAISADVVDELEAAGYEVERLAGPDRYATSFVVAQELTDLRGPMIGGDLIVARGDAFPDALAASPLAYRAEVPILLTRPNELPAGFATLVTAHGYADAIVMGGTGAVSSAVESDIDALITGAVLRVAGANRYETSVQFARFAQTHPAWSGVYGDDFIGLAIGTNFPDALCGGAVCGGNGGPLLLTGPDTLPGDVRTYIGEYSDTLAHVQAFGGTGVISDSVLAEVDGLIP